MKRTISLLLVFILMLSIAPNVFAIGEITGTVRHTDIRAYIDGTPIKSFNVDNWTCIVAEDLVEYGFDVFWQADERKLSINYSYIKDITSTYNFEENKNPIGSFAGYVYNTDIKTYVNGKQVTAFNIGGQTLIYIDDLMCFGDVIWNPEKREISYNRTKHWDINLDNKSQKSLHDEPFASPDGIGSISVEYTLNENAEYEITSENLEHISWIHLSYYRENGGMKLGFSLTANHLFADEELYNLCEEVSTIRYNGEILQNNADLANTYAKVYINDVPVKITDVSQGKGNNHKDYYFHLDSVIPEIEIKSFKFIFGK